MRLWPLLIFSAVVFFIFEIYLFVQIAKILGLLFSLSLLAVTFLGGLYLVKRQGLATLDIARSSLSAARMPAGEMLEGIMLIIAAALLLFPGFFTDFLALWFLIPAFRRYLIRRALGRQNTSKVKRVIEGEVIRDRDKP